MKIFEIIDEVKSGDIQAPKRLYVHTYKLLYSIILRYVTCDSNAKDVLQNTYLKVFKNISKVKFENDATVISWLKKICVNEALHLIRTKKNWDKLQYANKDIVTLNENELHQQEIFNLILKLPIQQRTVFNLFAMEGYTHKEIAKSLGISESNSRTLLVRARKYLSNYLINELKKES